MMKSTWRQHEAELETARRVREKLTEQRNLAHYSDIVDKSHVFAEFDAEIAALTKQPEPKEGV